MTDIEIENIFSKFWEITFFLSILGILGILGIPA